MDSNKSSISHIIGVPEEEKEYGYEQILKQNKGPKISQYHEMYTLTDSRKLVNPKHNKLKEIYAKTHLNQISVILKTIKNSWKQIGRNDTVSIEEH